MSNKTYGLNYERKEKKYWEDQGYTVLRSRGSFGMFDMIVSGRFNWYLISVKSTKTGKFNLTKHNKEVGEFNNAPRGTILLVVLYNKGKRKVILERRI